MFGPFRSFPFRGLALVAVGFLLASLLAGGTGGTAGGLGLVLLLPLFLFKMLFLFFIFGSFFRFAGAWGPGRGPHRGHRGQWQRHDEASGREGEGRWVDRDQADWEESLRQAREELREYDTPFPRPPRRSEGPSGDDDG